MSIHRVYGINHYTLSWVFGSLHSTDKRKLMSPWEDAGRDTRPGSGSAEVRAGRRGMEVESRDWWGEPLSVGSPSQEKAGG